MKVYLCEENKLPIVVFDINQKGNLLKALEGDQMDVCQFLT